MNALKVWIFLVCILLHIKMIQILVSDFFWLHWPIIVLIIIFLIILRMGLLFHFPIAFVLKINYIFLILRLLFYFRHLFLIVFFISINICGIFLFQKILLHFWSCFIKFISLIRLKPVLILIWRTIFWCFWKFVDKHNQYYQNSNIKEQVNSRDNRQ